VTAITKGDSMLEKIGFLALTFIQVACLEAKNANVDLPRNQTKAAPSVLPQSESGEFELKEIDKMVIYSQTLSIAHLDLTNRNLLPAAGWDNYAVYRTKTILPSGIDQLRENSKISKQLLTNFVDANRNTTELEGDYGVKVPIVSYKNSSDLPAFYKAAKRKIPETTVVIGISNIGVDIENLQGLVYLEYFSPNSELTKFYLLLKLSKHETSYYQGTIRGVENFEVIAVI